MSGTSKHELPFNRQAVDKAGPREGKQTEWKIATVPGLTLVVQPSGIATYFVRYQVWQGTKRVFRRVKIGDRNAVSLSEARERAWDIKKKVSTGGDPVATARSVSASLTFKQLAEDRFASDTALSTRTRNEYSAMLRHDAYKTLGNIPASQITREQIAEVLYTIERRGALRHTDHVKSAISSTFRWAIKRGLLTSNPADGLGRRATTVARNRVLSDDELRTLWLGLDRRDIGVSWEIRAVIKLAYLTGQRRLEIAGARQSELRGLSGPNPLWVIPGDDKRGGEIIEGRTKNGKEQRVPLSKQAAELFRAAIARAGSQECVFPVDTKRVRIGKQAKSPHVHPDSITVALRRLGFVIGLSNATIHDARRCIATWLGEGGVRPDVIDAILNHAPKSQDLTRRHYNHAVLAEPVRTALQSWADHIDQIVGAAEKPADNVVRLGVNA